MVLIKGRIATGGGGKSTMMTLSSAPVNCGIMNNRAGILWGKRGESKVPTLETHLKKNGENFEIRRTLGPYRVIRRRKAKRGDTLDGTVLREGGKKKTFFRGQFRAGGTRSSRLEGETCSWGMKARSSFPTLGKA